MCHAAFALLNNSLIIADLMQTIELTSDAPMFVADAFTQILDIHNQCRGHYSDGNPLATQDADNMAKELIETSKWIQVESDHFLKKQKEVSDRIVGGDKSALEELLRDAYSQFEGLGDGRVSQADLIKDAIRRLDGDDEEDDEDGLYA
jgi:hypothetical protein